MQIPAHFHDFPPNTPGWESWSPRPGIAPRFTVAPEAGRAKSGALLIAGNGDPAAYGAWRTHVTGIAGGKTYRFTAWFRTESVDNPRRSVSVRLDWLDAQGRRAAPPDYVPEAGSADGWSRIERLSTAPENARSVRIELALLWSPRGTVWWDDIKLEEAAPAAGRVVRAAAVFLRPQGMKSAAESVAAFCRLAAQAAPQKPDIMCLPEGITLVGTGKTYADVAESVPGPTTRTLGALAKRLRCYLAAGLYERVGQVIYNTAVLLDRNGELVGTYRKTHLPYEEVEAGISPGDRYPVFATDFGKAGLMICWDVQFPEPARAMAAQGADLLLLPIWGGSETLARARAIENHVYLVTSSYDMKTFIIGPDGSVLSEASAEHPIACAEIHLDRVIPQPWLGDMKPRTWKERRPDIPVEPEGR